MGNPDFEWFYVREYPSVFRATYALCGDRELAAEATQEGFARALARWARLGGEPWATGWVMTTSLNFARRSLRRKPEPEERAPAPPDLDALLDLRAAIEDLPARQQTALILHHLMDLPVAEVASAMGCRVGTVKSHLSKARAHLSRTMREPAKEAQDV